MWMFKNGPSFYGKSIQKHTIMMTKKLLLKCNNIKLSVYGEFDGNRKK